MKLQVVLLPLGLEFFQAILLFHRSRWTFFPYCHCAMGADLRESEQRCSSAVGVEELKLLASSIRSAAIYYDEAFLDAPDKAKYAFASPHCQILLSIAEVVFITPEF
jgi:hypothetical protein